MSVATLIYGNQLFPTHPALISPREPVIMIESYSMCTRYRYHKQKLILVLAAMREYRDWLRQRGYTVHYQELRPGESFLSQLGQLVQQLQLRQLRLVLPEDRQAQLNLQQFAASQALTLVEYPSPAFLTPLSLVLDWFGQTKKPILEQFYRWQRRRLDILMDGTHPLGGQWNYDHSNRQPLPKHGVIIPELERPKPTQHVTQVAQLVDQLFAHHPGASTDFWLPVSRAQALRCLDDFIRQRLPLFGRYEDAMAADQPFLFHSALSPSLNLGLLTPDEVVAAAVQAYTTGDVPLNSVEGFVRQVIGWREYLRGVYWFKPELKDANFFGFSRQLEDWWYTSAYQDQELPPPLRAALETVHKYGYNHHIERLMVLGNWFLLNEYQPQSVFAWFQTMYVDAYEWVMVPNVQGMSQYADGGLVATKPYIAGGNYLQRMGRWWPSTQEAQASIYTHKYWQFLIRNGEKLAANPRMKLVLKLAQGR